MMKLNRNSYQWKSNETNELLLKPFPCICLFDVLTIYLVFRPLIDFASSCANNIQTTNNDTNTKDHELSQDEITIELAIQYPACLNSLALKMRNGT